MEWRQAGYVISDDRQRIDVVAVHDFLANHAYWARGRQLEVVRRAIANSVVFGIYSAADGQVGMARVVTDRATFAWLCDVYVLPDHRGRGLGKWLIECVRSHPELQGLRRWLLATRDAHGLYERYGFRRVDPDRFMELSETS